MMRVVLDANVLVSAAILPNSIPRKCVELAQSHAELLISRQLMFELESVLRRKKFERYVSLENRLLFLAVVARDGLWIEIGETIQECRDPKDNHYLELAVTGSASMIISGDEDLLSLDPFRGISILLPAAFLALPEFDSSN